MKPILSLICLLAAIHAPSYGQSGAVAAASPAPAELAADLADPAMWPDWKTREIVLIKKLFGPQAIVATVPAAVADQVREFPKEWGPHGDGFGKRAASEYGQYILYSGIESAVQTIHKEDPRYFRLRTGNFFHRTAHVISGTFTARTQNGGKTFALSLPAASCGSWAIATRWNPRSLRTPISILEWGSTGVEMKAAANFFREFWPDVKNLFRRK